MNPALNPAFDDTLLSRIEDACLNASAPPQQHWLDGWLVRTCPGKARRARSINAVADGRMPWPERLEAARALYTAAHLPMVVRITPFTRPAELDQALADRGWTQEARTSVWIRPRPPDHALAPASAPGGLHWQTLGADAFAAAVGTLRGSPVEQQTGHAYRLRLSPVPYSGYALVRTADGQVLTCGQTAREGPYVGVYDVHTHESARRQGLAAKLCEYMLSLNASKDGDIAYLQVEADNVPAQAVYRRLGFVPAYGYHYRQPPEA
jgi:ribosomal protein S18 acetylase RimI-like enzyme